MPLRKDEISVIGHRNPDTDSICSAIAYATLKNLSENTDIYVPKMAGQPNEETRYVLKTFGVNVPVYVSDIRSKIHEIKIGETSGVDRGISLKKAWNLMKELNVVTLPITKNDRLEGVITTDDIAESYMDVYDNNVLSTAHTKYKNIAETIDGKIVLGNPEEYYTEGKVHIAAAAPELMEQRIKENDLVILSNRLESQLCAIKMKAGCIVACNNADIQSDVLAEAKKINCTIIITPHDTFTTARLINQSMPIGYFMTRENIVKFHTSEFVDDIRNIMAKKRFRNFPVLDTKDRYVGMISRRDLLDTDRKKVILVDHNEKSQAVDGIDSTEILEIIDHHRIAAIETMSPVYFRNQPLGCTATIVYQMYREKGIEIPNKIAGLLCAAILSDTLLYRSPTCTIVDKMAAEELATIAEINTEEFAREMFNAGSNLRKKSSEAIFYQDFKKFSSEGIDFGVGQINAMSVEDLSAIRERLINYLGKAYKEHGEMDIFFMLTNILEESTELLYIGDNAGQIIEDAFGISSQTNSVVIPGMVSRKKQLIPAIMTAISN